MSSREQILKTLRSQRLAAVDLPPLEGDFIEYEDPRAQFAEVLASVGGAAVEVSSPEEISRHLAEQEPYAAAAKVVSLVDRVGRCDVSLADVADPHDLADVDYTIAPGHFAVAENAAVWVSTEQQSLQSLRALPFITQHLALVVPANEIVSNMHQAYARLDFAEPRFGVFISGPSKTADIEQSLVIGAHGSRSLVVYLLSD